MTWRRYTSTVVGAGVVDVWRPPVAGLVPAVVLCGRGVSEWRTGDPSVTPRSLVDEGFACVCVALSGWGNPTDLNTVDAALTASAGFDVDVNQVLLVAHGAATTAGKSAGPAVLNWALRHIDRVAAVSLQSCVIDLAAHYTANASDRAAIDAAHGGNFTAVAATWNPAHLHRYEMAVHLFDEPTGANRVSVWWANNDPVTPPATTANIAGKMHAVTGTLATADPAAADPATVLGRSITQARDWSTQRPAYTRMKALRDYIDTSTPSVGYKGGDITAVTVLADGRELAMFGDHLVGTVDADGTFGGVLPRHNAFVFVNNGVFSQAYSAGNATPLQVAPSFGTGMVYSGPLGYTFENSQHQFLCWRAKPELAGFYSYHDTHVVAVDPTALNSNLVTVTAEVPLGLTDETRMPTGMLVDGQWLWILVREWQCTAAVTAGSCYEQFFQDWPDNYYRVVNRLARCPTGALRDIGQWRWWDGGSFVEDRTEAVPLTDTAGQPLGDEVALRRTRYGFVLAAMGLTDREIRLYRSGFPWGPWELYHRQPALNGLTRMGSLNIGFLPVWHPHLDPSATELMLAWGANQVISGVPFPDQDPDWYRPHYVVVPAPSFDL